jgi:hypothetical protein
VELPIGAKAPNLDIDFNPDGLPGIEQGESILGGILYVGVLACVAAAVIAFAIWAFASRHNNSHYAQSGRNGALTAFLAAIGIGAVLALVRWAVDLGGKVSSGKTSAIDLATQLADKA